jgi:hypothetical protein
VEKQWIDSTTGEIRSSPRLHAIGLKDLKPRHHQLKQLADFLNGR